MLNRKLFCVLSALLGSLALFAFTSTASASASGLNSAQGSLEAQIGDAISSVAGSTEGGAAVSRRKRARKMTTGKARRNALALTKYLYLDTESNWTDYGVRSCQRISRPRVDCYSYVYEELYDEYGYYDTILCDWYTASAWLRSGRLKVWARNMDCVYLSEV